MFSVHHGIGLEFNQPVGINKARDLHNSVCGPYLSEELAMNNCDCLPILDPNEKRAGTHNIFERRTGLLQGGSDNLQAAPCLRAGIAYPDSAAIWTKRRRAGDGDKTVHSDGARDTYFRLVRAAAGNEFAHLNA